MQSPPRLRTVLFGVNVLILLLPLAFVGVLRIYENELIRRTEAELIAQGAIIAAAFEHELLSELETRGIPHETFGVAAEPRWLETEDPNQILRPIPATLDRGRGDILPPAPDPLPSTSRTEVSRVAGDAIAPMLHGARIVTLAGVRVVDHEGIEVANTRGESGVSLMSWDEVPRAMAGEPVRVLRQRISDEPTPALQSLSRRTRVRVFVAIPVVHGDRVFGAVVLSRTPISLLKALYDNRGVFIGGLAGLIGAVLILTWVASRGLTRPIDELVARAEAVAAGDLHRSAAENVGGVAELARLSDAVDRMASTLRERADYIRSFAMHVSHEFKTPLTSMRGSAELLRDHGAEMNESERDSFTRVIVRECDRLERLVRSVLELARADTAEPPTDTSDVAAVLQSVERVARDQGRAIDVRPCPPERAPIAEGTLTSVICALVDNAFEHGGPGVTVQLTCAVSMDPGHVEITVEDDGDGISDANARRIFDTFFTTARDRGGTGMGLSIARTLVRQHGGDIELRRAAGVTRFVIRLPYLHQQEHQA